MGNRRQLPEFNSLGIRINWYGLADGNSFYCSCETSIQPWLEGRPVIVASNSDKIAIALNRRAKSLGFRMGDFLFEKTRELKQHGVVVFSSNYELYGDLSARMHTCLGSFVEEMQIESIDEVFLKFTGFDDWDIDDYGRTIIRTVRKGLWIPIALGIAPTQTLAKAANKLAKTELDRESCYVIATEEDRAEALRKLPLHQVWGIGRRWHDKLCRELGTASPTAWDFTSMYRPRVRKLLGVTGERTYLELNGIECIPFSTEVDTKDRISTSRMFAECVTEYEAVFAAVLDYLSSCCRKLRGQRSYAGSVYVYYHTSVHENYKGPKDARGLKLEFPTPLNTEAEIIPYVRTIMRTAWPRYSPGQTRYRYQKAGVILEGITTADARQLNYDSDPEHYARMERLQTAKDLINGTRNMDSRLLKYAAQLTKTKKTKLLRTMKTGNPTTLWKDRFRIRNT
ncbi:MAG: Y-family DNA polymerase [Alistipes sp.]|nr:Y-family DNA polymerase [Alistipes sp.]